MLKLGQKVRIQERNKGKQGKSEGTITKIGIVTAKYRNFFVVSFAHYKECFQYSDISLGIVTPLAGKLIQLPEKQE